jgi:hypothetical protein
LVQRILLRTSRLRETWKKSGSLDSGKQASFYHNDLNRSLRGEKFINAYCVKPRILTSAEIEKEPMLVMVLVVWVSASP